MTSYFTEAIRIGYVYRFRNIASYLSKVANFSFPTTLVFGAIVGNDPRLPVEPHIKIFVVSKTQSYCAVLFEW